MVYKEVQNSTDSLQVHNPNRSTTTQVALGTLNSRHKLRGCIEF